MNEREKHTLGPWYVGAQNDGLFIIDRPPRPSNDDINPDRDVTVIAKVYRVEGGDPVEAANARLIAAAPDLLAALVATKHGAEYPDELGDIIDAAVAKATVSPAPSPAGD